MSDLFFVYGSLKKGFHNDRFLSTSRYVGKAITCEPNFRMGNVGSYPEVSRVVDGGYIIGEVYECSSAVVKSLDKLEANGVAYQRERIGVSLMEEACARQIEVWIYLWQSEPCREVTATGLKDSRPLFEWPRLS